MDVITILFSLILGAFIGITIDVIWWKIDFKKAEKGFEAHEHYHIAFELFIVALIINHFTQYTWISLTLSAIGVAFFVAEWLQGVEVVDRKVKAGHQFAYGAPHFKASTIIGVGLTILTILVYFYLQGVSN